MNASRWLNAVAGAGSVGSSAGTYTACTEVMAPFFVRRDPFLQLAHFGGRASAGNPRRDGIRPRSADTSEPACEKRKMLSTNSSVSAPVASRNHSAIVSAGEGHAETGTGRLVHLAEHHRRSAR